MEFSVAYMSNKTTQVRSYLIQYWLIIGVTCPISTTYVDKRKYLVRNESFVYKENIVLHSIYEKKYLMYPTWYDMAVFAIGYNL